jgi:RNA polymerase sigma-70 factor (ECF subfamily)
MSNTAPTSDAELLAALPHDLEAFEVFYRRYVRRVTTFAAGRCSSAEDVADVVAQTFVRLLDVADRYDPTRAEPAAFVFAIAANLARDVHRSDARRRALISKLAGRDLLDAGEIEQVETAIDAARAAGPVHAALDEVPPGEQEMLRLVADGRSPGQAARELGISPAAAWTRLSRARRRLRTHTATSPDPDQEMTR